MKYRVQVDGETLEVELVERGGCTYAVIEGDELPAELTPVRASGSYSLLAGTRQLPVVASGPNDDLTLVIGSETWHCAVLDSREALAAAAAGRAGGRAGGGVLRSVMPGIVRDVRIAEGDTVERGHPLLILEAMKMENEIRADADGTVTKVHVTPGTAVAKGDPLVTLG